VEVYRGAYICVEVWVLEYFVLFGGLLVMPLLKVQNLDLAKDLKLNLHHLPPLL